MKFRSKNLLVTGGAGFIGSNFIHYILSNYDCKVINIDALTYAGNLENTLSFNNHKNYKFIHGNICDKLLLEKIFKNYEIDGVINFAAESHVDNSIKNPDIFIESNISGVLNLLNTCNKFWMKSPFVVKNKFSHARFHQVSTDEVFGSIDKGSFTEESNYQPNSPYSASKASADFLVRSFNKTFGLNTSTSISSNNFGKNQHEEKLIPTVIKCILENKKIPVYGNGENVRDWIFVIDNCSAIDLIFNTAKSGSVYNVSSENTFSNIELIKVIHKLISNKIKKELNLEFVDDRFGHDFRYSLNSEKIRKELKWESKTKFVDSLNKYIKTFL